MAERPMPKPRTPDPALPNEAGRLPSDDHRAAHKEALDVLKINQAVTSLASRFDTRLVMRVLREWLDYMDRQVAHIDGSVAPE